MHVNVSPSIVNDVATFLDFAQNIKIAAELKSYRPLRRPVVGVRSGESEARKRKRRLIVRDWFFYAVWASRIRKLIKSAPRLKAERDKRVEEFKQLSNRIVRSGSQQLPSGAVAGEGENKLHELSQYMQRMRQKIDEETAKREAEREKKEQMIQGVLVTFRCQEIGLTCFASEARRVSAIGSRHPTVEFRIVVRLSKLIIVCMKSPCVEVRTGRRQYDARVLIREIQLFAYVRNMVDAKEGAELRTPPRGAASLSFAFKEKKIASARDGPQKSVSTGRNRGIEGRVLPDGDRPDVPAQVAVLHHEGSRIGINSDTEMCGRCEGAHGLPVCDQCECLPLQQGGRAGII